MPQCVLCGVEFCPEATNNNFMETDLNPSQIPQESVLTSSKLLVGK